MKREQKLPRTHKTNQKEYLEHVDGTILTICKWLDDHLEHLMYGIKEEAEMAKALAELVKARGAAEEKEGKGDVKGMLAAVFFITTAICGFGWISNKVKRSQERRKIPC